MDSVYPQSAPTIAFLARVHKHMQRRPLKPVPNKEERPRSALSKVFLNTVARILCA